MKYFEDFAVGEEFTHNGTYAVTEAEIREVGERWDPQPFHVDPVAATSSPFGGLVASSVHLFAISVALGTSPRDEPVAAVSALGFDKIRLQAPARPGDELTLHVTVLECRVSTSRPELGIVRARGDLINQRSEIAFSYESASLIKRRP